MGDLDNLSKVNLSFKELVRIHNLSSLIVTKELNLSHNHIQCIGSINACWSLTSLNLSHNALTSLNGFKWLRHLKTLFLDHNQLSDFTHTLSHLKWIGHSLQTLTLNHNPMMEKLDNVKLIQTEISTSLISLKLIDGIETCKRNSISDDEQGIINIRILHNFEQELIFYFFFVRYKLFIDILYYWHCKKHVRLP